MGATPTDTVWLIVPTQQRQGRSLDTPAVDGITRPSLSHAVGTHQTSLTVVWASGSCLVVTYMTKVLAWLIKKATLSMSWWQGQRRQRQGKCAKVS